MRADLVIGSNILTAFRTGEGKLRAAVGAYGVVRTKRVAAIRTEIYAARRAYFVVLADRLATVAAERGSLDGCLFFGLLALLFFVHDALVQLGATVRADCGIGGDFLVTYRAIETELGPAIRTHCRVRIHFGPTLGAIGVKFFGIDQICCHGFTLDF